MREERVVLIGNEILLFKAAIQLYSDLLPFVNYEKTKKQRENSRQIETKRKNGDEQ